MPLLSRILVGNATVAGVATIALVLTPVTLSFPAAERELIVLAAGLTVGLHVLVLCNPCSVISAEKDARWAREESAKVRGCDGVLGTRPSVLVLPEKEE